MWKPVKIILPVTFVLICFSSFAQGTNKVNLYTPAEKAETEIAKATSEAKKTGKHVLLQVGGNWCTWCIRFHDYVAKDKQLDSLMNMNYVVYHLNYSKENFNKKLMSKYRFPQRFGFPVFLVLDADGNLIHTQNSWYLEDGKTSYDREKIKAFLRIGVQKYLILLYTRNSNGIKLSIFC